MALHIFRCQNTLRTETDMKIVREKQFTSGEWRTKVKMTTFKPIDDDARVITLKKLDHISRTIIYMIYSAYTLQEVELRRMVYESRQHLNASKQTPALNRCKTRGMFFPWKGTRTISPKRKLIAVFSLSAGRARQTLDHKDKILCLVWKKKWLQNFSSSQFLCDFIVFRATKWLWQSVGGPKSELHITDWNKSAGHASWKL